MFETGDFQTPAPPESGVAGNAVASTPQDHWLYNELVDGFHIDRVVLYQGILRSPGSGLTAWHRIHGQ